MAHLKSKAPIQPHIELLDKELYLKGLHLFDVDTYDSVSALRGHVVIEARKPEYSIPCKLRLVFRGVSSELCKDDVEILKEEQIWDLVPDKPVLAVPFEFLVSCGLPESICTAFHEIVYSLEAEITFEGRNFKPSKTKVPIKVMRSALNTAILEGGPIITEGTYKGLFRYQVAILKRVLYTDDSVDVEVNIDPLSPLFTQYKVLKFLKFKLMLLQQYNPDAAHMESWRLLKKKHVLQEHSITLSDVDKQTGHVNFSMKVNLKQISEMRSFAPLFANRDRYALFEISHFFRLVFIFEEKRFSKELPCLEHPRESHPGKGSAEPETATDTSELIAALKEKGSYTLKVTELLFKNCIILLDSKARSGNVPPPAYTALPENTGSLVRKDTSRGFKGLVKKLAKKGIHEPLDDLVTLGPPPSYLSVVV